MPRFYFDVVVNGDRGVDPQGLILDSADVAHREGLHAAKTLSREMAGDADPADCELEVVDEHRKLLVRIPFAMP